MNPTQRNILVTIIIYFIVWNTKFLWDNLPGIVNLLIFIMLLATALVLGFICLFQIYHLIADKPKNLIQFLNIGFIIAILLLTYFRPFGLIDHKVFESKNALLATYEGKLNSTTTLAFKPNHRFRKTIVYFGIDHTRGEYEIVNDTIKLKYDRKSTVNPEGEFVVLNLKSDSISNTLGTISYHSTRLRKDGIEMNIRELDLKRLK